MLKCPRIFLENFSIPILNGISDEKYLLFILYTLLFSLSLSLYIYIYIYIYIFLDIFFFCNFLNRLSFQVYYNVYEYTHLFFLILGDNVSRVSFHLPISVNGHSPQVGDMVVFRDPIQLMFIPLVSRFDLVTPVKPPVHICHCFIVPVNLLNLVGF